VAFPEIQVFPRRSPLSPRDYPYSRQCPNEFERYHLRENLALIQLLRAPSPQPTPAQVVTVDLEFVGPNLDAVPLDEVMQFRAEHGAEFRAYARRLRSVVREMAGISPGEQTSVLDDRLEEIREAGEALRRGPFRTMVAATGIGIGIAGGVTSAVAGEAVGGILSAFSTAAGVATLPRKTITPYSYLFSIGHQFA
jgi:hypothetical protein